MPRAGRSYRVRRRALVIAAVAVGLGLGSGCGRSIVRLVRKGAYDEAIAEADGRRRTPSGRAARAWATALTERDRSEQARSVLLTDYRKGGDLHSLVALADLERGLGLEGLAASHYGRIIDLSLSALGERPDVCALLRRRAEVWAIEGAGLAAEQDLRRADDLCGVPSDTAQAAQLAQLRARVEASAQRQVDAQTERSRCGIDCDDAPALPSVAEAIDGARAEGPRALRAVARHLRVQLPPADVVQILAAELRGAAGPDLLIDDEVRQLVGEQDWSALAPAVMSQPAQINAYLQLRLASVMSDVPVTVRSRTGPGELDVWLAQSMETTDGEEWRILAWAGDLSATELALGSRWRPRRRTAIPSEPTPAATPAATSPATSPATSADRAATRGTASPAEPVRPATVRDVPPAEHWTSRVAPTADNLSVLLLEGRLRHQTGHERTGLMVDRYAAARALDAGLTLTDVLVARQAAWHLAHGRPWQALAVATVVPRPQSEQVAAAAATALRLTEAFCGGPCKDDEDRALVERVLGEAWVQQQQQQWVARSRGRSRPAVPVGTCPSLGELLAPDATGRLSAALVGARSDSVAPQQGQRLRAAIEEDLGLGCAGRFVVPLLREGQYTATAGDLAQLLAHDAALQAPRALTVHAALAMIAGQEQQASLLAIAAGSVSSEPVRTWRDLARHAYATGHRELALRSLREALLHTPRLEDADLHRALVLAGLSGIATDWNLRRASAGSLEPMAHVRDLVQRVEPVRRFAAREDLARALAEQPWLDADARQRLAPALWPDPQLARAHAIGRAWVGLASGRPPDLEPADVGPHDLAAQELLVVMRKQLELPPATAVFVEPDRMESLRLSLASHSRIWVRRWRMAIGLASYGSPRARARAMAVLLEMAEPAQRRALVDLILEAPAVVEPQGPFEGPADGSVPGPAEGAVEGLVEAPLLATPEDEMTVVFALPFDPLGL